MKICLKCQEQFKTYVRINGKYHNLANRKFCLNCSPYGGHNTRPTLGIKIAPSEKQCPRCKNVYPLTSKHFYKHGKVGLGGYCKKCNTVVKLEQLRDIKKQCVEYLGSKCILCQYSKCLNALDFHHIDPSKKDMQLSKFRSMKFESLKKELNKCILTCATCHREIHAGLHPKHLVR